MSDTLQGPQSSTNIKFYEELSKQMGNLYLTGDFADVTFCIKEAKIPAHRIILASRSTYFRALLLGGFAESNEKEIALEVPLEAFKYLLQYFYSAELSLEDLNEDTIMDILCLAHEYGLFELVTSVSKHLGKMLKLTNVWKTFDIAKLYKFETLIDDCWLFVDLHSKYIVEFGFESLSEVSDFLCCSSSDHL